jgi:D-alanyl-D-alanine carboxypeptidase
MSTVVIGGPESRLAIPRTCWRGSAAWPLRAPSGMRFFVGAVVVLALGACGSPSSDRVDAAADSGPDGGEVEPEIGEALQRSLDETREAQNALGAGIAITVPGQGVWVGVSGLRAPGGPALTVDDPHPIGSITKVFTAVVVLQLVEAGAIALDDKIVEWFPSFPRAADIEVRHLLQHTSGIVEYLAQPGLDVTEPVEPEAILTWPAQQGLQSEPGATWDYSNTNYVMLGLIAEAVTGESYAALVRSRISEPLGLEGTFVNGEEDGPAFLLGYSWENGTYVEYPREHPSWAWAAGAIVSTLPEQVRFIEGLLGGELLGPGALEEMQNGVQIPGAPAGTEYGLGLEWGDTPFGRVYTHGGLIHDVQSATARIPDLDLSIAGYANTYQANPYALLFGAVEIVAE